MRTMSPGSGVGRSETLRHLLTSHLPLKYAAKCNDLQELDLAHSSMPNIVTPKTVLLGSGAHVALFCVECGEEGVLEGGVLLRFAQVVVHLTATCAVHVHQAFIKRR